MIQARSLTKKYGSRTAISDMSFTVRKGEIVGFLGPNGAGKTTTMKILTGYMAPNQGSAYLDGINVLEDPLTAKRKIGYLPEAPPLYTDMAVEDYLKYVARLKLCAKAKIPQLVESAIKKAGLQSARKRLIQNLSKGFKQRAGLAQALVNDPEILILDEPTVGLDPKQVIEIRETLKQLKGQHTIILSTHILSEVQITCDRVIIINEGKIATEDSLEGLSKKMRAKRQILIKVRKASESLVSKMKAIKGVLSARKTAEGFELDVEPDERVNEAAAKAVISGDCGLIELKEKSFNLEDLFIRLVSSEAEAPVQPKAEDPGQPKSEAKAPVQPKSEARAEAPVQPKAEDPGQPKSEAKAPAQPKSEARAEDPAQPKAEDPGQPKSEAEAPVQPKAEDPGKKERVKK